MLKTILQAAALAAAVLASVPALAQEGRMPDVRVYYGDLDLSDPVDVSTLDHRLLRAVKAVCPSDNGVREMSRLHTIALCRAAKDAEIAPLRQSALAAAMSAKTNLATAR
jgi:UrcA family protein